MKRARHHRSVAVAVVAVIIVAIVGGGSLGLRSLTETGSRPTDSSGPFSASAHPWIPLMHNGQIDVFGNGVRALTPRRPEKVV